MQKDLPDDVKLDVVYDSTKFVRASIKEVQDTIVIAFLLVVFIIFVFLSRVACDNDSYGCDPDIVGGSILRDVYSGIFDQCAFHACRGAFCGIGSG